MNQQQPQKQKSYKLKAKKSSLSQQRMKNPPQPRNLDSAVRKAPISQTRIIRTGNPVFQASKGGADIIIKHREYLFDLPGSVAFTVTTVPVNPGLSSSFPWLSCVANLYESYVIEDLKFEFQTMAPTTAIGSVMSAVDYDASDSAPADKIQLASYQGYARSSTWDCFEQRSPKEALHKQKTYFTRSGGLAANQDIKMYDVGNFFIATQGQANADPVGELYVSYSVRFITPQLGNVAVGMSKSSKINTGLSIGIVAGSSAPLVPTGLTASGTLTLTAIAPFNCLLVNTGITTVGTPVPSSAGSTCIVQSEVSFAIPSASPANSYCYTAELAFLVGQTFVFQLGAATWTSNTSKIAQYNTLVL